MAGAIVELAPDALVCVDAGEVIMLVNSQVERMFGDDRRELIGEAIEVLVPLPMRLLHPEDRASYSDNQARSRRGLDGGWRPSAGTAL